jgi:hypothetical protein
MQVTREGTAGAISSWAPPPLHALLREEGQWDDSGYGVHRRWDCKNKVEKTCRLILQRRERLLRGFPNETDGLFSFAHR